MSLPWAQWLAVSGANEVSIIKAGNVQYYYLMNIYKGSAYPNIVPYLR